MMVFMRLSFRDIGGGAFVLHMCSVFPVFFFLSSSSFFWGLGPQLFSVRLQGGSKLCWTFHLKRKGVVGMSMRGTGSVFEENKSLRVLVYSTAVWTPVWRTYSSSCHCCDCRFYFSFPRVRMPTSTALCSFPISVSLPFSLFLAYPLIYYWNASPPLPCFCSYLSFLFSFFLNLTSWSFLSCYSLFFFICHDLVIVRNPVYHGIHIHKYIYDYIIEYNLT